jgi:AmmeMemoRadiSam system protein B/AmmeMemoRadiSam system protein A
MTFTDSLVRPAAVAGMFYPSNPKELDATVQYYLAEAAKKFPGEPEHAPKAIIAPHAGYVYSGLTASSVYNQLLPVRDKIKRVVMMGPCHRVAVQGLALPSSQSFATPLGEVPLDMDAVARIVSLPQVSIFDDTHKQDHALEVHLPFLQKVLREFKIVPMIVGQATPDDVAQVLEILWGGEETLILISSDLSHYKTYDDARKIDDQTRVAIEQLDPLALGDDQACGRHSIKGLMVVAKDKGMTVQTTDVRNSGDTAGTKDRVVGYGAWAFYDGGPIVGEAEDEFGAATQKLLDQYGEALLNVGARAILHTLKKQGPLRIDLSSFPEELRDNGACFVTLNKDGKLRGCIGSIQAHRPLLTDVAENACKAAFQDTRFPNLTADELDQSDITMHISVLSPQVPMTFTDEADLVSQIRPNIDGLILQDKGKRGVFLPAVWESLPEPQQFFTHLKRKAGLPLDHWSGTVQVWRYVTKSVHSEDFAEQLNLWRHN